MTYGPTILFPKILNRSMNKTVFILLLLLGAFPCVAQDKIRTSPEDYIRTMLETLDKTDNQEEKHTILVNTAEVLQATGDLNGAAELFKKASLAVKGSKDFESLYRSAVLNVETAFFREAEADLRAIMIFCEDTEIKLKAAVLTARIKNINGETDEAKSIMTDILQSSRRFLPREAILFARELFTEEELEKIFGAASPVDFTNPYAAVAPLITPESVFGGTSRSGGTAENSAAVPNKPAAEGEKTAEKAIEKTSVEPDAKSAAAAIQLGSFSVKDNAVDLQKHLTEAGYAAEIRSKDVNGKTYYTVTIPVDDGADIQVLLIKLKEKGFEGYPVY